MAGPVPFARAWAWQQQLQGRLLADPLAADAVLLLEHERILLDEVVTLLAAMPLSANANARFIGMPSQSLAEWAVAALLDAGAARIDGGMLLNA